MVTYKTIVVPTDGSENAKRALEHALAVADRNKLRKIWKKLVKKFLTM